MGNVNLGELLLKSLEIEKPKKHFDEINKVYGVKVLAKLKGYCKLCKSLEKEIKDELGVKTRKVSIIEVDSKEFKLHISDEAVNYNWIIRLPKEVIPYFENLKSKLEKGDYNSKIREIPEDIQEKFDLARELLRDNNKLSQEKLAKGIGFKSGPSFSYALRKYFGTYKKFKKDSIAPIS